MCTYNISLWSFMYKASKPKPKKVSSKCSYTKLGTFYITEYVFRETTDWSFMWWCQGPRYVSVAILYVRESKATKVNPISLFLCWLHNTFTRVPYDFHVKVNLPYNVMYAVQQIFWMVISKYSTVIVWITPWYLLPA